MFHSVDGISHPARAPGPPCAGDRPLGAGPEVGGASEPAPAAPEHEVQHPADDGDDDGGLDKERDEADDPTEGEIHDDGGDDSGGDDGELVPGT